MAVFMMCGRIHLDDDRWALDAHDAYLPVSGYACRRACCAHETPLCIVWRFAASPSAAEHERDTSRPLCQGNI